MTIEPDSYIVTFNADINNGQIFNGLIIMLIKDTIKYKTEAIFYIKNVYIMN